jgi:hypothetical protein
MIWLFLAFLYLLGGFIFDFIVCAAYERSGDTRPQWVEFTPLVWPVMVVSLVMCFGGLLGIKFEQRRRRRK